MAKKVSTFRNILHTAESQIKLEAIKSGFNTRRTQWCNFAQGQPEVSQFQDAPSRLSWITLETHDHEASPVAGSDELRDVIAEYYNRLYREDAPTKYRKENVSVVPGSRVALSRILTALGEIRIGHRNPESPLYQHLLDEHRSRVTPVPLHADPSKGFSVELKELEKHIAGKKCSAFLMSNPCNPTGQIFSGQELKKLVAISRKNRCTMIMDEVYSHYVFGLEGEDARNPLSIAPFIKNVERDPILIVDGLGKGWRYPGWQLSWILGPPKVIETINQVAEFLDGGASVPAQRLAIKALEMERSDQERMKGIEVFAQKRSIVTKKLESLGMKCAEEPCGTFYVWADISCLPKGLNNADKFFRRGLEDKLISMPGRYFNLCPGDKNPASKNLKNWVRFSFAPSITNLEMGVEKLAEMVESES